MHKKIILSCAVAVFATPFLASAALTQGQISAVISILQAFGASQSVIVNVESALSGQSGGSVGGTACVDLTYNLYAGQTDSSTNGEVTKLQQFLSVTPATGYFGPLTEQAVQRYQSSHGIVSSGSPDTTGYGFVGPETRLAMSCNAQNNQNNNQDNSTQTQVHISAAPAAISLGQSTTITWSSTNATSCTGSGFTASGTSGSVSVSPTFSVTYGITCSGAHGAVAATASVTVNTQQKVPTVTLTASTSTVAVGQSATITWSSTNATSCTGSGFTASGTNGSVTVYQLTKSTTYSITCTGPEGSATSSATVTVGQTATQSPTVTLSAAPPTITAGQSSILTWSSTNATSCTGSGFTASGTSGSVSVSPTQTTAYSVSCTGAGGSASGSATVTVNAAAVPPPTSSTTAIDVQNIIPAYNPALDAVRAPAGVFGTGKIWHVGPNETNKTFSSIASQLHDGDIVEIDAATYGCTEQSIVWYANDITIVGVGGRPVFNATGCGITGDKGIFDPRGNNLIVDNIEFVGAHGPSGNDAGIRYDGTGYVYITNSYFHDNQDGILFTPSNGSITNLVIDHSEFSHNGAGDGQSHNMYISSDDNINSPTNSFVLRFSYSHNASVGHEVKTRADTNYILYNRIADEASGDASYEIDVPQGGLTYIIGNVLQKGPNASNSGMVSYSAESERNPVQKLYVVNNTFVNQETANSPTAVNLYNKGLAVAEMTNNLIVGIPASNIVGYSPSLMTMSHNVVTSAPGFYDAANRIYYLTAGSPAIGAGVDPGSANGFSLMPQYQFTLPHGGEVRPVSNALDAGAYEYVANQTITPAPTVTFAAAKNPIDFNTAAQFTWSSTNATYCTASGGWSGTKSTSGSFSTSPLTASKSYSISCTGPSGTVSSPVVTVVVNDSAQANALGTYTWKDIPNSKLATVCPSATQFPGIGGAFGCASSATNMTTGVYVPDTQSVYFMGGSESYGYYGNEVYAFNLKTMQPERVTDPTIPANTKEYVSNAANPYNPPYALAACSRALHGKDGSIAMAANGIVGQASWDPVIKKIVVGPWGYQRQTGCTNIGSYMTDQWTFDPVTKTWAQVAPPDPSFQATDMSPWFVDPVSGIAYFGAAGRNASPIGAYLLDYSTTPPTKALVDNAWPFALGGSMSSVAVDTTHHYAFQLTTSGVALYDLAGLSMTKYGTNGTTGTTGLAGGAGPQFYPDTSWTVTGDTSILSAYMPSLTYNPKLDLFVAWAGTDKVYFIELNYGTKTANIISKQIPGGPTIGDSYAGLSGHMIYIPTLNEYLVFTGMNNDFYLLVPPSSSTAINTAATQNTTQLASVAAAFPAFSRTLLFSSTGPQVNVLQDLLKRLGLFVGNTTDYFGPKTKSAVTLFQLHNGISPIGVVGPQTRRALNALLLQ